MDYGNPVDVFFWIFRRLLIRFLINGLLCKLEGLGIRDCLLNLDW